MSWTLVNSGSTQHRSLQCSRADGGRRKGPFDVSLAVSLAGESLAEPHSNLNMCLVVVENQKINIVWTVYII